MNTPKHIQWIQLIFRLYLTKDFVSGWQKRKEIKDGRAERMRDRKGKENKEKKKDRNKNMSTPPSFYLFPLLPTVI